MKKRSSGVLMHVSTLWGNYSEGGFGKAAKEWIDFLADCGFSYWQVLPFCLPDDHHSPYRSYSAFSLNPNFIDLDALHARGLLTDEEIAASVQKTPYSCEFERLDAERLSLLSRAADRYGETEELSAFFAAHPHVDDFCRFMALKSANGMKAFVDWETDVPDEKLLRLWRFTQFEFVREWRSVREYARSKGIGIIGDIPIYVAWDSADVWSNPSEFLLDERKNPTAVAGVPPDYFCAEGQLWGNPLYDWQAMEATDFRWWRDRVSFMAELFDGVRIDHFRGIESYYSVPATEKTAKNGKWVKGPGMKLVRALREAAGDMTIIAEDLGDITDEVRALVEESGFPGMRVLQFGFLGDDSSPHLPHNYEFNSVAYTGTHDNNTLLGYVWEQSDADRRKLLDYCGFPSDRDWNCEQTYDCILRVMFASHAGLLILPVQDLLLYGSDTRLNKPGTADGNWSYRLTAEQLGRVDRRKFFRLNHLYGRK